MSGPAPQPTELKRRRGNPGKRPLNPREPKPLKGLPAAPGHLTGLAKRFYEALGLTLVRLGIMTELDGPALADMAELEELNARLSRALRRCQYRFVIVTTNVDGAGVEREDMRANPLVKQKLDVLRERRMQAARFGLDPATRSRITTSVTGASDPDEAFLDGEPS